MGAKDIMRQIFFSLFFLILLTLKKPIKVVGRQRQAYNSSPACHKFMFALNRLNRVEIIIDLVTQAVPGRALPKILYDINFYVAAA